MYTYYKEYEVVVIGGGHAGVEAALAASRLGCTTLLLTMSPDTIGQMSCNPAVGGSAKGHLVREIDALGGEMGRVADYSGIQFRMLNKKKGPAVWAPRAQCDKKWYQFRMKWICELQDNLDVKQGQVTDLICNSDSVIAVDTSAGTRFRCKTVVVTTGTFLNGLMHVGDIKTRGGRSAEAGSVGLSASLKAVGLELSRFKTGTPPRLLKRTIDFSRTETQPGDDPIPFFSFWRYDLFHVEHPYKSFQNLQETSNGLPDMSALERNGGQAPCYITYTTEKTAELIRGNLHRSPLFSGAIDGVGPRYCPSIEDKIVRFGDKARHQIFLEPEGIATEEIYVNGLSTSMPFDVQVELVRSVVGCENAEIIRPAYAVEYDFAFPNQLYASLETKKCCGLFLAGQINGTSGYEEAAAQGLIAGINAARRVRQLSPMILSRDAAYIGVLIDDLVTKGTQEPYRMFTSRAEHRLLLRQDNADLRLSELGHRIGLLPETNYRRVMLKRRMIEDEMNRLVSNRCNGELLTQMLRRPGVNYRDLPNQNKTIPEEVVREVEILTKYAGYIVRQESEVNKCKQLENKFIPSGFDYSNILGLSTEARQKLVKMRPATVGQAARIPGVSPADISVVLVSLRRSSATMSQAYSPGSASLEIESSVRPCG